MFTKDWGKFSTKTRGDEQLVGGWACFLGISACCSKSPSSSISRSLIKFNAFILEAAIPRWFSEKSLHLWSLMQINILDAMTRVRLACFWAYFESHYTDLFFGVSSGWEWLLGEENQTRCASHLPPSAKSRRVKFVILFPQNSVRKPTTSWKGKREIWGQIWQALRIFGT